MHQRRLIVPDMFYDFEFVESYRLDGFTGEVCVQFSGVEVDGMLVRWQPQCGRA